jgi:hypothetical protein
MTTLQNSQQSELTPITINGVKFSFFRIGTWKIARILLKKHFKRRSLSSNSDAQNRKTEVVVLL